MKLSSRSLVVPAALLSSAALYVLATGRADVRGGSASPAGAREVAASVGALATSASRTPRALEPFQKELLDVAFVAASAIPSMPHVKTRSRAQERVVVACLELDQARLAARYVEGIENWRRGAGHADLAFHLARDGREDEARRHLELARASVDRLSREAQDFEGEIDSGSVEAYQDWREDRIRAGIARAHLALGEPERADEIAAGLEASESGIVELARADRIEAPDLEAQARVLDSVVEEGNLDRVRNALDVGVRLLGRFYEDEEARVVLARKLAACLEKSPAFFRLGFLSAMASTALEHGDRARALELVAQSERILAESRFLPEDSIPVVAGLAGLLQRAGESDEARRRIDSALETFQARRESIASLTRAETLVPIAEAYRALGDAPAALEIYRMAIADGAENPNAVPRAEDLCDTCCSMARSGVAPDAELWLAIRRVHAGLREPW